jgi:hypothetical protein
MNLPLFAGIVVAAVLVSVAAMIFVRRIAGPDQFLTDTTRGSAIFGVVGTGFAVILAFVMFFSFQGFNDAKSASEAEASAVADMFRTAKFFPEDADRLGGQLVCYGRSVVHQEWPAMAHNDSSDVTSDWRLEMEDTLRQIEPETEQQISAFSQLLSERDDRSNDRRLRLAEAAPAVSTPVWVILILGGLVSIAFVLLFIDRKEAELVQVSLIATVAVLVVSGLSLVSFLDHPYEDESGSIQPIEMEQTIGDMQEESPALAPPCNSVGLPSGTT